MRILVTGGTGFLGSFLVDRLLADGFRPRILARSSNRGEKLAQLGAEVVWGDLAGPDSVARATQGMDLVYHCAAKVNAPGPESEFLQSNVRGTECVLKACFKAGVKRVVYLSSLGIYGAIRGGCIDEDSPYDPAPELRGPYSHSKIIADKFALDFARQTRLPLVLIRPGPIYGAGRSLPAGLFSFQKGRFCLVVGHPDTVFPLNYVENLVDALVLAGNLDKDIAGQFNIVDDDWLTLRQYHQVRHAICGTRTFFAPSWPFFLLAPMAEGLGHIAPVGRLQTFSRHQLRRAVQSVRYDTRRIREQLGWKPRIDLFEALRRTRCTQISEDALPVPN